MNYKMIRHLPLNEPVYHTNSLTGNIAGAVIRMTKYKLLDLETMDIRPLGFYGGYRDFKPLTNLTAVPDDSIFKAILSDDWKEVQSLIPFYAFPYTDEHEGIKF